ncbi:MAG: glycosyltransferase family 4 protein [Pelomonas sp.]|nr:glycosyltransferase family 4 protein [Roseateles sp.]
MLKLVFVDPKCPSPYDVEVLAQRGLGGTEATVVRVSLALAAHADVSVVQHNRVEVHEQGPRLRFLPWAALGAESARADHVVFVQRAQDLAELKLKAGAQCWIWLHNFAGEEVPFYWRDHWLHRLGVICVSRTHALRTREFLHATAARRVAEPWVLRGGLSFVHNPLQPGLARDATRVDPDKLVFFSSPHKGLEQVIERFDKVYRALPSLRLYVADPGYFRRFDTGLLAHPGIVRLGTLPQAEVIEHVREALCVFYPQTKRPETFGLVYAEANAVGTPVLAHDFGAAREVLHPDNPPIDVRDDAAVLALLREWRGGGRPQLAADPRFALGQVAAQWLRLFENPAGQSRAAWEIFPRRNPVDPDRAGTLRGP